MLKRWAWVEHSRGWRQKEVWFPVQNWRLEWIKCMAVTMKEEGIIFCLQNFIMFRSAVAELYLVCRPSCTFIKVMTFPVYSLISSSITQHMTSCGHTAKRAASNKRKVWSDNFLTNLCIFICSLFNKSVSNSYYIASNDWMIVNNKLEGTWKEAIVAWFEVLSWHLLGWAEENYTILCQNSWCPDQIGTKHLLNAGQKCYHLPNLLSFYQVLKK
jgi:hypothetical protein